MTKKPTTPQVSKLEDYDDGRPDMYRVTFPNGNIYDVHADDEKTALEKVEADIEASRTPSEE